MQKMLAQAEEWSKHPRLFWDGCGFPEMDELEQGLHMRGGAGSLDKPSMRTYWLYTDIGRFIVNVENSYRDFWNLIRRLYQLETRKEWTCQLELMPIYVNEEGRAVTDNTRKVQHRKWHHTKETPFDLPSYEAHYVNYVAYVMNPKDMCRFRVRYNRNGKLSSLSSLDPLEPQDKQVVNLKVPNVGIAYWYLPSSGIAVNVREETFRNAVECLLPQHKQHRVRWSIDGTTGHSGMNGQLLLMAEAPSKALWNATIKALFAGNGVNITLEVIEDRVSLTKVGDSLPRVEESSLQVGILMPGHNMKGWYERNREEDIFRQNTQIFPAIRAYAQTATSPDILPLRIWPGVQYYDDRLNIANWSRDHLSKVLPGEPNTEVEQDIWLSENLAYTWDAVVVKPDFNWFMIHCLTDKTKEDQSRGDFLSKEYSEDEDGLLTLDKFRITVSLMLNEVDDEQNTELIHFSEEQDYISIQQTESGETFWIGPGMTQYQWHSQVYSWLNSHNIYFEVHQNWPVSKCLLIWATYCLVVLIVSKDIQRRSSKVH
jgi:hypothetical protein